MKPQPDTIIMHRNQTSSRLALLAACLLFHPFSFILAQGPLTPPGAPAPTMKTLDQIEPRTPISSIPFTITQPGSYYVTRNLTMVGGFDGITIEANNVTLDLGGFTLDGAGTGRNGVTTSPKRGLQVRNGNAQNWTQRGFDLQYSSSTVLEDVQAYNNAIGIYVSGGAVSRCAANFNTETGIIAVFSNVRDCAVAVSPIGIKLISATLRTSRASSNSDSGILAYSSVVESCQVEANRWGILDRGFSNIRGNTVVNSESDGIRLVENGCSIIAENNVTGSGLSSGASGIWVQSDANRIVSNNLARSSLAAGVGVAGSFNTIDGNSALLNNGIGISVAGSKNTVIRNSSLGNTPPGQPVTNYSIGAGNNPGPVTAANTATNPLSNTQ